MRATRHRPTVTPRPCRPSRSAGILLLGAPWEVGFRQPDESTTIEDILLRAEEYRGHALGQQTGLGSHGESAFLLCALKNQPEHRILMRFLLAHYEGDQRDALVNARYVAPQFHGETALHFAVVHRDFEMTRLLIEAGADPDAHADGLFFYERLNSYFGGWAPVRFK